ncbi:hypothetical protein ES705_10980 [subsurface metagenome]
MVYAVYAPRVNANEDILMIGRILVKVGQKVKIGDALFEVETDKALMAIEAEKEGCILKVSCRDGDRVPVGTPLVWLGESPDETIPKFENQRDKRLNTSKQKQPTMKALKLLKEKGLSPKDIPFKGTRLTAKYVEKFLTVNPSLNLRTSEEIREELSPVEKGMLQTVTWQKEQAVPTYLEIMFDQAPWERYAKEVTNKHKLLMDPMLGIMAYRLVELAREHRFVNATISEQGKILYRSVHLGFTVQVKERLYLVVIRKADELDQVAFLEKLGEIQRRAFSKHLSKEETTGATVCFTSMAKWGVSRHIPILAPKTALIVAHSSPKIQLTASGIEKIGVLGATYDHRILTGHHVAQILQRMSIPPTQ